MPTTDYWKNTPSKTPAMVLVPARGSMKYPNFTWESKDQFREHFKRWIEFGRRIHPNKTGLTLLRYAYQQARDGWNPNPSW